MIDGKLKDMRREAIRSALAKTACNFSAAGRIVGMSYQGVQRFAEREGLIRKSKSTQKSRAGKWVLA